MCSGSHKMVDKWSASAMWGCHLPAGSREKEQPGLSGPVSSTCSLGQASVEKKRQIYCFNAKPLNFSLLAPKANI